MPPGFSPKFIPPNRCCRSFRELQYIDDEKIRQNDTPKSGIRPDRRTADRTGADYPRPILRPASTSRPRNSPRKNSARCWSNHHLIDEQRLIEVLSLQLGFPFVEPEFTVVDRRLFSRGLDPDLSVAQFYSDSQRGREGFWSPLSIPWITVTSMPANQLFNQRVLPAITTKKSLLRSLEPARTYGQKQAGRPSKKKTRSSISSMPCFCPPSRNKTSSDIHLEPMQDRLRARFRTDGVLVHHKDFPLEYIPGITSRIKVLCEADIAERRRHQGGRLLFERDGKVMDMRVSFFITVHGEKIVLRLLNRQAELLNIDDLGISPRMLERFRMDALDCPSGVVIVNRPHRIGENLYGIQLYQLSEQTPGQHHHPPKSRWNTSSTASPSARSIPRSI